jgi:hypothetical protein
MLHAAQICFYRGYRYWNDSGCFHAPVTGSTQQYEMQIIV